MSMRHSNATTLLFGTAVLACGAPERDTTAPVLRAAAVDASSIRLTFSEAMVVGQADPSAFRLSLAVKDEGSTVYYALAYDGLSYDTDGPISDGDPSAASVSGSASASATGSSSDSYDPTYTTNATYGPDPDSGGYEAGGYEEGGYARPGVPDSLAWPIPTRFVSDLGITAVRAVEGETNQLELVLAGPLAGTPACDALPELVADGGKAGIFVHHREGSGSPTDAAGNALPSIGAHWVDALAKEYVELQGDFPNLDPYLPIACP